MSRRRSCEESRLSRCGTEISWVRDFPDSWSRVRSRQTPFVKPRRRLFIAYPNYF
uniref:Uncharacterized protein n=1 Tax=Physcomitrium patens TaxID=3218 RepID=A0A7I3Z2A7_PHYPA